MRYKKRLELEGDLSEEQIAAFQQLIDDYGNNYETYLSSFAEQYIELGRTKLIHVDTTSSSEEVVSNILKDALAPKVILVNHEKRLPVDAILANIGIKYQFMYLSVYQLLKQHIEESTDFGKKLLASKKQKTIDFGLLEGKDEF